MSAPTMTSRFSLSFTRLVRSAHPHAALPVSTRSVHLGFPRRPTAVKTRATLPVLTRREYSRQFSALMSLNVECTYRMGHIHDRKLLTRKSGGGGVDAMSRGRDAEAGGGRRAGSQGACVLPRPCVTHICTPRHRTNAALISSVPRAACSTSA